MKKVIVVLLVLVLGLVLGLVTESVKADFTFGTPKNLGPTVNSTSNDQAPSISSDGLSLYFSDHENAPYRPSGHGLSDIWVTTRETKDSPWSEPVNLGSTVNSRYGEWDPDISTDGLSLYFADYMNIRPDGYGSWDIYVTVRSTVSESWSVPVNLG